MQVSTGWRITAIQMLPILLRPPAGSALSSSCALVASYLLTFLLRSHLSASSQILARDPKTDPLFLNASSCCSHSTPLLRHLAYTLHTAGDHPDKAEFLESQHITIQQCLC